MTVVGNVNIGGTLAVYNTEPDRGGITIQAGGMVGGGATDISTFTLRSIPGTPALASIALQDTSLSALAGTPDRVFASMFGAWPNTYKLQPAAVRLPCPDTGCRQALSNAVAFNPDRVIWVEGDLTLETVGDVGSLPDPANPAVAGPAVIVVTGNLLFTGAAAAGGVRIFGVVYTRSGNWTGAGELQGGAFVEGNLASTAAASVVFNGPVIDTLRLRAGSFVRVPGSWRDFP